MSRKQGQQWRRVAVCAAFAILATLILGCGGGSDDSTSLEIEVGPLSKSEFIKRADEGCVRERGRMGEKLLSLGTKDPRETLEKGRESILVPGLQAHAEVMQELGAPAADQAEVQALVDAMGEAIEEVREKRAHNFKEVVEPFARYNRLAAAYGFKSCQFH